ncbi:MAG: ECF transporter S component [Oscillospiraceae bacterium]|nr:ECF transporter S component [Oscillospiraceae bacterium]
MNKTMKKLVLSAMFLALGMVLPLLTGQIQEIGSKLLPMHIPVLLCGMICGWPYGFAVGLILPLLRSVTFGMPPLFPTAVAMTFELATYGLVSGLIYSRFREKNLAAVYVSLIGAMIAGRLVWGVAMLALLGAQGNAFTWEAFLAGAVLNAIPGILVQLVLIPAILFALQKAKLVPLDRKAAAEDG